MAFRLPPQTQIVMLERMLSLPEPFFERLLVAIGKVRPTPYPANFVKQLFLTDPELSTNADVNKIIGMLISLASARLDSSRSDETFVDEVIETIFTELSTSRVPDLKKHSKSYVKSRLVKVFNIKPLFISAKATSVLREYDRSFVESKIMTDVRPIFDISGDSTPDAAVIVHMLKLAYQQGNELKEFYLAMDDVDLSRIIANLERAQKKSRSLRKMSISNEFQWIDINPDI